MNLKSRLSWLLLMGWLSAWAQTTDAPRLVSVKKIWHGARHNAFTDLIRFEGKWFCAFRESEAHVGGNGRVRLLQSEDGEDWASAALMSEEGIDLRDPKLSITPDRRLMLVMGGSRYEGRRLKERQARVAFSNNALHWTAPKPVLEKGDWLWRVTWHQATAYGLAYFTLPSTNRTNQFASMKVKFVASSDGVLFQTVTKFDLPGAPNEATVRFLENGDAVALLRRETGDKQAWIGRSSAPYTDWRWQPAGMQIGGPNFIVLNDGSMLAGGRQYTGKPAESRTFVGRLDSKGVHPELILPSGGDCSYPGLVWHEGLLWISYYSSHEGSADIYLAKVRLR